MLVMVIVMVMVIKLRPVTYSNFFINWDFLKIFHSYKLAQKIETAMSVLHLGRASMKSTTNRW